MWPTFWWLFFSGLQLYQRETGVFLSILRNFEEYFEVHLIIPTHEYHFTFYFRVLFQRPHFTVLLSIKERRRLKRCKDNVVLSTFLRRCSDVLIITSFYQQYKDVNTRSRRLNGNLLFLLALKANGASLILYSTNQAWLIGHFHCDTRKQQTCVEYIFKLILKKYFVS